MTRIAHLSDPHFGTVESIVKEALLADLREHPVDLILLTGDITQRARSGQFREARAFLDALAPVPWLTFPGNHDIPLYDVVTRFTDPYRLFNRYLSAELEPSFENDLLAVICVNATRATRHKHGELSEGQIERTAARLEHLPQPFKVVALHQPLAVTLPRDENNLIRGARRALDRWVPAGADLFLGGHIHLPYCVAVQGAGHPRTAIVLQAGTALSNRIRFGVPNSYNRICLERTDAVRRMRLERRDFDEATQTFSLHQVHVAVPDGAGWRLELLED